MWPRCARWTSRRMSRATTRRRRPVNGGLAQLMAARPGVAVMLPLAMRFERVFFEQTTDRVVAGTIDDVQLYQGAFQQFRRPPRGPWAARNRRGRSASPRRRIEDALAYRVGRMLAHQGRLQPHFHQLLTGARDGVRAGVQCRGDAAVAPSLPSFGCVRFQQDTRLQPLARRGLAFRIRACSRSRSSALSLTIYLFTLDCFAVTAHLRRCPR